MNVLLGVTGSVAAKLTPKIQESITKSGYNIQTVFTNSSLNFTYKSIYDSYTDEDEWKAYREESRVLHIDLVKWADVFIIVPCSANVLGKISNGISDNLLTSCARAWDYKKKMIIAPAMNTQMYVNPLTKIQIDVLTKFGVVFVEPQSKELFCGDIGIGAMANIDDIIKLI